MPVIDFHNHYYPPRYMAALQSGASSVKVTVDRDGNPNLHYPGDYNVAVRGHRDLERSVAEGERERARPGEAEPGPDRSGRRPGVGLPEHGGSEIGADDPGLGVVAGDHIVREPPQGLFVALRGNILEGADADVAGRHARKDRAG